VGRIFDGQPNHPVALALAGPAKDFDLRRQDFLAVIDGCALDAEGTVTRPKMAVLDLYCDRVASAVGRLSVRVFGPWTPACDDVAASLGRALQLTNILRDVEEDAGMGRLYLPEELLSCHGIVTADPAEVRAHPLLPLVRRDLGALARGHFAAAKAAMARSPRRTMRPAALMCATYRAILDRMEAGAWATGAGRVGLPVWRKLWYAVRHGIV
jgi:phytoene synthase